MHDQADEFTRVGVAVILVLEHDIFKAGISAPVRTPRGRDIDAACGQLKTSSERKTRAELDALAEEKLAALG